MNEIVVIKCGGQFVKQKPYFTPFLEAISELLKKGVFVVVIHGGGPQADELQKKLGIPSQKVNGKRITDAQTLNVVKMVYKGLVNLDIIADCIKLKIPAVGISGVDGNLATATKRPVVNVLDHKTGQTNKVNFGYVGDIKQINTKLLENFLEGGYLPVVACLGINSQGEILNINADSLASCVALALEAKKLIFITDVKGISNGNRKADYLKSLSLEKAKELINNGIISDGMIPKIENVERALSGGVDKVLIVGGLDTKQKWLGAIKNHSYGTVLTN